MAAADHNPTRRALLGAALGVPLSCHPGLDPGSALPAGEADERRWMPDQVRHDGEGDAWTEELTAFRQAQAAVQAIEAVTAGATAEEEEKWLPAHDLACAAMDDALADTLAAPA